jgi:hypothetical protein
VSLQSDWDAAVSVSTKPENDLQAQWDKAKPVKIPAKGAEAPKKPADDRGTFPPLALADAAATMGSGMIAKPVSDLAGLASFPLSMMGMDRNPADVQRRVREALSYQPRTEAGANIAAYNPMALVGKGLGWAGEKAGQLAAPPSSGPVRAAIGSGVQEAVPQVASILGARYGGPAATAVTDATKGFGRQLMQSALKPPMDALKTGKADAAVDTLLEKGVNVSRGGADKLRDRIGSLDDKISAMIDNSPATIDKGHVGYRLQGAIDKFEKQVTPLSDIKAIQKAWDEFLDHPLLQGKQSMSVKEAQEMKRGTYKALGDKAYGELKGADMEAQKTLARGLKEEIAKAVPEVHALNAEQSKLIGALSLVERRALMEANKNPAGLGWLTTNPAKFAAWMADRSGTFKSLVARMIYSGADALPPVGAAAAPAGAFMQGQIPPPPSQR